MQDASPEMMSLFCAVLERSTDQERAAYLDAACGQDKELRQRIEALLRAHEQAGGFLAERSQTGDPQATTDEIPISERPGTIIGPYKLLEQIGEGGFGIVFMAEQTQPVRRKVALKVIKPGMDTRQIVARFEAERQALALMDHPNIAKVLDGGATASGRPYFVMELVKGAPIIAFCDHNQLTPRQRLELFVSVCQAVQHAHQKGIIHRDLKPSNVLVTVHDTTPVVKIIDFGVAKALGQELTDKTLVTGFAQMVGTPLYMSPEQAGQSGLDMDTRSDIYSLGVLLYELLTGTTPFEMERFRKAGYEEIRHIIQEEEPPRPSTRISTLGQAATMVALKRQSDPKRLRQLVRGELDWIVMKCLEKDRSRRYETANSLAMDVQRYLHDEPVLACPPSVWYRCRKFVRRNRAPLAVVGLILFCIVLIGVGSGWVLRDRAAREEALNQEVNRALDEADTLIQSAKWLEAAAAVERAKKLLAAGGRQDMPARLGELQNDLDLAQRLENIYRNPLTEEFLWGHEQDGEYSKVFADGGIDLAALSTEEAAERIQARKIRRELVRTLDLWSFIRHRIEILDGRTNSKPDWKQLADIAAATDPDPLRNQLRAARKRADRKALEELAASTDVRQLPPESLLQLMTALYESGGKEEARAFARRAVVVHPEDFWLNDYLAVWSNSVQPPLPDDEVRYYTAARSIRPNNPYIAKALGSALVKKNAYTEAIVTLSQAIELKPDAWDPWWHRGRAFMALGEMDKALADFCSALERNPKYVWPFIDRSITYRHLQKYEEALADATTAIKLAPKDGWAWFNRGLAHICLEQYDQAVTDFSKALEQNAKHADSWYQRGFAYYWLCQYEKAISDYSKAIELQPSNVWAWLGRCNSYYWLHQYDQAITDGSRVIELDPKFGPGLNNFAWYLTNCSNLKFRDLPRAIELAEKAVEVAPKRGDNWNTLGVAHYRAGDWKAAVEALEQSRECHNGGDGYDFFFLAMASWQLGKKNDALKWYEQAVQWIEKNNDVLAKNPRTTEELRSFRAEAVELLKVEAKKK